jgi:hypothetical protein
MEARLSREPENGLWVVGLVASVGGLDALGQVLAPLPAAMVALQHTRPEHQAAWPRSSAAAPPSPSNRPTTATGSGRGWSWSPTGPPHPDLP